MQTELRWSQAWRPSLTCDVMLHSPVLFVSHIYFVTFLPLWQLFISPLVSFSHSFLKKVPSAGFSSLCSHGLPLDASVFSHHKDVCQEHAGQLPLT